MYILLWQNKNGNSHFPPNPPKRRQILKNKQNKLNGTRLKFKVTHIKQQQQQVEERKVRTFEEEENHH